MKKIKDTKTLLLSVTMALLLAPWAAGCGGSEETNQSEEVANATLNVMAQAEDEIFPELAKLAAAVKSFTGDWIDGTKESFTVNGTIENPLGGSAAISGAGGKADTGWTLQLTITFNDWITPEGMALNGSLDTTYALTTLKPFNFMATCGGVVKLGPLPVVVDLKVTVADKQIAVCGSVAGQPIDNGHCY